MAGTLVLVALNGLVYGLLLFMLSSGLTLIFGMMGIINLAHASFYMLGAYAAYTISHFFGFWPGLVVAPLIVGAVGAVVERYALRRVHRYGHMAELLFTFGLALVIGEIVPLVWGTAPVDYRVPAVLDVPLFHVGHTAYSAYRVFMMAVSLAMFAALFAALARSRLGFIVRAALTHPEMVSMLGHDVPRIFTLVFGAGCALAGLAGVIGGNALTTQPGMAESLGPIVFAVVVMGGLGSIWGAFLASVLIGLVQTISISLDLPLWKVLGSLGLSINPNGALTDLWNLTIARAAPTVPYLLLVLVMVFRPRGLVSARVA